MKIINILAIFILLLFSSCVKKDEKVEIIIDDVIESQMLESYKKGLQALNDGDALYAAKHFTDAELLFPQSEWAPKSLLMAAYSYYSQDFFADAIAELERFIKTYPQSNRLDYAYFLLATCYYEKIIDEKKDLKPLLKSKEIFIFITKEYPETDFALDAKFKLDLIDETLAGKEMYIGRYYIKKEKWIAAINRFKFVIENYSTTIYIEEALHRLVELHYKIGLEDEAKKYASLLGYNYQSSDWYQVSYKIFNKEFDYDKNNKKQKKGNFILRKFKNLFEN
ncbi:MAG: outer membrane protein assembly factor BamD [Candidatus Pelagibacter sp. TMED275]|nr:MAG: outer membrane protein assembly factor BamD [Candidatus Pelagibacter sp. TMED275]|tara:strand:- start:330 stop:1169 length:840 start_codon:yes stop_codon:yes gene_type:complete